MREPVDENGELIFTACRLEPMRKTRMPVAPCMERALGYCGSRRFVVFTRARFGLVHWMDGIDDGLSVIAVWDRFLNHPLIHPHISGCRFQARVVAPEELTMFASPAEALRVELEELGDAILLDREKRVVWAGFLAQAFLYLTVAVAFEDLPDDDEEKMDNPRKVEAARQIELLEWLDCRLKGTSHVSGIKSKWRRWLSRRHKYHRNGPAPTNISDGVSA